LLEFGLKPSSPLQQKLTASWYSPSAAIWWWKECAAIWWWKECDLWHLVGKRWGTLRREPMSPCTELAFVCKAA